jgi:hypothetical protein
MRTSAADRARAFFSVSMLKPDGAAAITGDEAITRSAARKLRPETMMDLIAITVAPGAYSTRPFAGVL